MSTEYALPHCTFWVSVAFGQDDSQLAKIDSSGEVTLVDIPSYGEIAPEHNVTINLSMRPSASADASTLLYASGATYADTPRAELWHLASGDGTITQVFDWTGIGSALISPDGQHIALAGNESAGFDLDYGVIDIDGRTIVVQHAEDDDQRMVPVRWLSDSTVYFVDESATDGSIRSGVVLHLDGTTTDQPVLLDAIYRLTPSSDMSHFLAVSENSFLVYDESFEVVHELEGAAYTAQWIDDSSFVYLRGRDLRLFDLGEGAPRVVLEDALAELEGPGGVVGASPGDDPIAAACG